MYYLDISGFFYFLQCRFQPASGPTAVGATGLNKAMNIMLQSFPKAATVT
ncbi:MAG: hypothetical protein QNK37_24440 [Acidobacteriota bacterium]|nr:hypothetical protein [Acidobacteriota bacterium]